MSTALPNDKIEMAIDRLESEPDLKESLRRAFHRKLNGKPYPLRHCSNKWAKNHPETAVTPKQRELAYKAQKAGCSYREIEGILHLGPDNGMDAYRCVKQHAAFLLVSASRKKRKPLYNKAELSAMMDRIVPTAKRKTPEYRKIVQVFKAVETVAAKPEAVPV